MQGVPPAHPAFLYRIPFHRVYTPRFIGLTPYEMKRHKTSPISPQGDTPYNVWRKPYDTRPAETGCNRILTPKYFFLEN